MKYSLPGIEWDFRQAAKETPESEHWSMVDYEYFREIPELVDLFKAWKSQPFPGWRYLNGVAYLDATQRKTIEEILPDEGLSHLPDVVFLDLEASFPPGFRASGTFANATFRQLASWKMFPAPWKGNPTWKRGDYGRPLHVMPLEQIASDKGFPPESRLTTGTGEIYLMFLRRDMASPEALKKMFAEWVDSLPSIPLVPGAELRGQKPLPALKWLASYRLSCRAGLSFKETQTLAKAKVKGAHEYNDLLPIYSDADADADTYAPKKWSRDISKARERIKEIRTLLFGPERKESQNHGE